MATGAYDANGIWQYGEGDNIALFSDLLNLGQESVSDAFTDDRARITQVENNMEATSTFVASSQAARDSHWGVPANATQQLALQNLGARTVRTDSGITEQYFGLYNVSTNPGGRDSAGWYPINKSIGLTPIKPTSVAITGSGSSATATAVGSIGFSQCTAITLNGVFSTEYNSYRVNLDLIDSADSFIVMQYTIGGTPNTGANYFWGGVSRDSLNTTITALAGSAQTFIILGDAGYESRFHHRMEIHNPKAAAMTKLTTAGTGGLPNSYKSYQFGSIFPFGDQFDGFKIWTSAGSMYGTVSIYGYND